MNDPAWHAVDGDDQLFSNGETWQAADGGGWLPGIYADEAAARLALAVIQDHYGELVELARWELRGRGDAYRPITVADLESIR